MVRKSGERLKRSIFLVVLFLYVFFLVDWSTMLFFRIAGMHVYFGDLFFFLVLACAAWVLIKNGRSWRGLQPATAGYPFFLAWLALEVFWGWWIYGYRALGEARYVLPFFAFFIPYLLLGGERRDDPAAIGALVRSTTWIAAAAAMSFLLCSLVHGRPFYFSAVHLENQKIWVHKTISSDQSFHILLAGMFLFFLSLAREKFLSFPKIIFPLLLLFTLPVHNRMALVSLFAAFLFLLALGKRVKEIVFACACASLVFILLNMVPDIERLYYPVQRPRQALDLNVEEVRSLKTGYWRWYQNKAALKQALKKPLFGHHLGGYFGFFIPETKKMNSFPPHNQYILVLLKTGMVGLALLLAPLFLLLRRLFSYLADERLAMNERSILWLLLLLLLAQLPYGMGFAFIPLYAVYFGFGVLFAGALAKKYPPRSRLKVD